MREKKFPKNLKENLLFNLKKKTDRLIQKKFYWKEETA